MNTIKEGLKGMGLDKELIQLRIDVIERNLQEIASIVKEGYENFSKSFRNELAAKHALLESIEACVDIANHIIAVKGFRRPTDYKDVFKILQEKKIIVGNLSIKLQEMAKFRNLLVHRYAELETKKLFKIMKDDAKDIKEFVHVILNFIKN
jgi:uncharacterized protein YutE (UPF0331/DUF86 family)